ncbi:nucleoside monophosphate kinase [Legionella shakespearei]|uniref:Adenylate kinase n=1 Tax=Legionella shakespearei DSM 23087 TaxID=1122169 RepID=A0A0W0YVX7_9GAMM|nr:nucleoside monophosphate kinase [Legionella shakespearei]KTD60980.1 adenylate kinase [Legionella shakespearei DSM 23087]
MKIVLLAGAPGSGKSTQGAALMKMNANIKHLSLGEVVRNIIKDPEHPLAQKYHAVISSGTLLPDHVIAEILANELEQIADQNTVVLLDGYPRTSAQYQNFKEHWGNPAGIIHLDVSEQELAERMEHRQDSRSDDNEAAIARRLDFYKTTTLPVLELIKKELDKNSVTVSSSDSIEATSILLYASLQHMQDLHTLLSTASTTIPEEKTVDPVVTPVWFHSVVSPLWQTYSEYQTVAAVQETYETTNFSFSLLGKKIVYLETAAEIETILRARSSLGHVYRHFSMAAGLKHDFVATDSHNPASYRREDGQINTWKLIHNAFGMAVKGDKARIEHLIDVHLDQTFLAEKTFELDTTFDRFFCSFWSDYLFGSTVSPQSYMENREAILAVMRQCFYSNNYKALDPTGLSSLLYSYTVSNELKEAKEKIKSFISNSTATSFTQRFKAALRQLNESEGLELSEDTLMDMVADNVFDLFFEPDFLENVMYETLAIAIKEHVDLREGKERSKVYSQGMKQGYLFPMRSRILEEAVTLPDGTSIAAGSHVYFNLKKAGLYHSSGPRRCVGQAYTHYFKEHFFNRIEGIDFKVKSVSFPEERMAMVANENVPGSPERYQVSWNLKRDEAMRHLPYHNYKGNKFFNVLALHQKPDLNEQMVKQCKLKIKHFLDKREIDIDKVVIVTPEVRGLPLAAQVAKELRVPLYTIRKKGGYKMAESEVYTESYDKGYGDPDVVELPVKEIKDLAGKKVIFLDDGLASGQSALACIKLIERQVSDEDEAAQVLMVLTSLKHDYVETTPKLSEHCKVKTLFDCHGGKMPAEQEEAKIQIKLG